jgi:hypothetical protein
MPSRPMRKQGNLPPDIWHKMPKSSWEISFEEAKKLPISVLVNLFQPTEKTQPSVVGTF